MNRAADDIALGAIITRSGSARTRGAIVLDVVTTGFVEGFDARVFFFTGLLEADRVNTIVCYIVFKMSILIDFGNVAETTRDASAWE